jgi:predicted RNA-binding protein with PIN domain
MAYLIDGNNLLGHLFPGGMRDPENRLALVRKLKAFQRFTRTRVTIVFDGRPSREVEALSDGGDRFAVRFPAEGENADGAIMDLIDRRRDRRRLFVVSSDRELRAYAREAGAHPLPCREFETGLKRVLRERRAAREMDKPDPRSTPLELNLWLNVFGERKR